jgi:hypothetical protein
MLFSHKIGYSLWFRCSIWDFVHSLSLLLWERRGSRIPWPLGRGWSEPSLAVLYSLKLYQSSFFCKMRFFDTIATGGSSYLWLGCDKRWNCAVLAMAMVRLPTTSCWCLSIDTRYSTINELKRIASLYSTIFAQRKATKSMLWKL